MVMPNQQRHWQESRVHINLTTSAETCTYIHTHAMHREKDVFIMCIYLPIYLCKLVVKSSHYANLVLKFCLPFSPEDIIIQHFLPYILQINQTKK